MLPASVRLADKRTRVGWQREEERRESSRSFTASCKDEWIRTGPLLLIFALRQGVVLVSFRLRTEYSIQFRSINTNLSSIIELSRQ